MVKFKLGDDGISEFYAEHGYVILSQLNSHEIIDSFISEYERFKLKRNYLFNAQDTNRPEKMTLSKEGFIVNSIMDPLDLVGAKEFAQRSEAVMINDSVSEALRKITGAETNIHWQSMFFDKSTGTVPHQDSYYLDSDPPGKLLGAWYALEDIYPEAGCFYICPGSNKVGEPLFKNVDHIDYVREVRRYIDENNIEKLACPLKKGDVLFWNSLTFHGAFENTDPNYSRKSFTSHFIPEGLKRNNATVPRLIDSEVSGIKIRKRNRLKERLRYFKIKIKYLISNRLFNRVDMEMKSNRYE